MKVQCEAEEIELEGDYADDIPSLCVTCGRCDHKVEVFGTSQASLRRGLIMLREECPQDESNYYVATHDE